MKAAATSLLALSAILTGFMLVDRPPSAASDRISWNKLVAENLSELDGVWRSRGYGWLVEIENGNARFYDETPSICVPDVEDRDEDDLIDKLQVSSDGRMLRAAIDDPAYLHTFDKIDTLPSSCGNAPDTAPRAVFDAFVEMFSTHYAFFDERNIEWPAMVRAWRSKLTRDPSGNELLEVFGGMVSRFDDTHVSLKAVNNGRTVVRGRNTGRTGARIATQAARENIAIKKMWRRWQRRYWERDVFGILLDGSGASAANDKIAYGLIGDGIGYMAIRSMEGFANGDGGAGTDIKALDRAMKRAMGRFRDVKAIILDISINDGGYDEVARALAGRFAAKRTLGYYKYAGDAGAEKPQAIYIEPSQGRRFTGPVYLVTSNASVSAAEIFTMSMRALPNVTHVGEATRGSLSNILSKPLPNGWSVNLSNEIYLDAQRKRWEGTGIPPQVPIEIFSAADVTVGHVEAIRAIVGAIKRGAPIKLTRR